MFVQNILLKNSGKDEYIFSFNGKYSHTRVSAVLFLQCVDCPHPDTQYRFVQHPHANLPIDMSKFSLAHCYINNNRMVQSEGETLSDIVHSSSF